FIQADTLPIASLTTQGMNRYIYCENDPVNSSDPTGSFADRFWGAITIIGGLAMIGAGAWAFGTNPAFAVALVCWGLAAMLEGMSFFHPPGSEKRCRLQLQAAALAALGFIFASFSVGVGVGFRLSHLGGVEIGKLIGYALGYGGSVYAAVNNPIVERLFSSLL
ncbi:MAG: hypothetical protein JSU86_03935, partial [Phycisphaerales bacterium]